MKEYDVLWIILIVLGSLGLSWFQYAKQLKTNAKRALLFAIPRCIAYICLGLLFLNLKVNQTQIITEKPDLIIGLDNSISIATLADSTSLKNNISSFLSSKELNSAFNIQSFSFSNDYEQFTELNFRGTQTNISKFLKNITKIYRKETSPILLFTDGQQTQGQDYKYNTISKNRSLIPVIIGDTTRYSDLKIDKINTNSYAFLNNQFPIEIFVSSNTNKEVKTELLLKNKNKIIAREPVNFSENTKTQNFKLYTKASKLGVNTYTVELAARSEKNTLNNTQEFAVEVIDERTKILLLYDNLHPDIGMLKKSIASNPQKELKYRTISDDIQDIGSFNLVILYQPNSNFDRVYSILNTQNINHIVIGGTQTDYNFVNRKQSHFTKNTARLNEEYYAIQNKSYESYQQEDLKLEDFPPLRNTFGEITIHANADILQYQKINGFSTQEPLIMTVTESQRKVAYIFGEDLWRWRMKSFVNEGDFKVFDRFFDQLFQFTSSNETKKRLVSNTKAFYNIGDFNTINVQYYDRNYTFDPNKKITLNLTNKNTKKNYSYAFLLKENSYAVKLDDLQGGDYVYSIKVDDEALAENGEFKVIEYMIERSFYRANKESLETLSDTFFYIDKLEDLKQYLSSNQKFKPIQKNIEKTESLINWKILLVLIIVCLSFEWFSRKYYGLI